MTRPARKPAAVGLTRTAWAIEWRPKSRRAGKAPQWLSRTFVEGPDALSGCPLILLSSEAKARLFIAENYSHFHSDRPCKPVPVKVEVTVRAI